MLQRAVKYKELWLAPGSHALILLQEKNYLAPDAHLRMVLDAEMRRAGSHPGFVVTNTVQPLVVAVKE